MGLSLEQARSIGIGHLHPSINRGKSVERLYAAEEPASKAPAKDGMNKLERDFKARVLEPAYVRGDLRCYWREPIKLRLAGRTFYSPDFLAISGIAGEHGIPPRFILIELKGYWHEDAKVKTKVAASLYPCFDWLVVYRDKGRGWLVHRVTSSGGIEINPTIVSWINGNP
jgi:hypothetical protein